MDDRRKFDRFVVSGILPGTSPFGRIRGPWPTGVTSVPFCSSADCLLTTMPLGSLRFSVLWADRLAGYIDHLHSIKERLKRMAL